jgi:hypothetical protein
MAGGIIQCRNKKERKPGKKRPKCSVYKRETEKSKIRPLTLDPGRHLAGLDMTRLLPLDATGIDSDCTS